MSLMLNDERCYMKFLKDTIGLTEFIPEEKIKIKDLSNFKIPKYGIVVNLKNHLTYISDDYCLHDTFDCRNEVIESILGYF